MFGTLNRPLDTVNKKLFIVDDRTGALGRPVRRELGASRVSGFASNRF